MKALGKSLQTFQIWIARKVPDDNPNIKLTELATLAMDIGLDINTQDIKFLLYHL